MSTDAFVTGGSRGIGRAIVLGLIERGIGCAFTYRSDVTAAEETIAMARSKNPGVPVRAYPMELADAASVQTAIEQATADFDGFWIVVSNAGIVKVNATVMTTDEEWNELIATNLTGPFQLFREMLMHLLSKKKGGRIIAVTSIVADGASGQAAYAASKAGLTALVKSIAKEYGPKGITANVVAPGYIETRMTEGAVSQKHRDAWIQFCPAKRTGRPEDVAIAVVFLASPEAGFINGEVIHASGGLNQMP